MQLVIDSCNMKDECLAEILEALIIQNNKKGDIKFRKLVYSNNHFGQKSTNILGQLLPDLTDLSLNNAFEFG